MSLSKLGIGDGQGSLACYSPRGCKESDMTKRLNWTEMNLWQSGLLVHYLFNYWLSDHAWGKEAHSVYSYSVQFSCSVVSDSLQHHESQHARPPCPSPTPGVYSNSCPSSRWCHPAISSSVVPFSSCPQSLPASGSFPMSQLLAWGILRSKLSWFLTL